MTRKPCPLLGVVALFAVSACSTVEPPPAPEPPPLVRIAIPTPAPLLDAAAPAPAPAAPPADEGVTPRPGGAADHALHAQGVYLVRPHQIGELEHLMVTEVWRHNPALGPAPVIGTEWMPGHARAPMAGNPELALVCVTATPRGQTTTTAIFRGGRLVPEGVTLAALRRAVEESPSPAMPARLVPPGVNIDESIATADAVYLVRFEPREDGQLDYHVSEVWRHARPGPAPEIGAVVGDARPRVPAGRNGPQSGDMAVMFLFPSLPSADSTRHTTRLIVFVRNGYLWGTISLSDLHDRVLHGPAPAPGGA